MYYCICIPDVCKKFIPYALSLACPFCKSGYIYNFYRCMYNLLCRNKLASSFKRLSGTLIMLMFDLFELNAKSDITAFVFDMQLNIVVFPVFVNPTIPQRISIPYLFLINYLCWFLYFLNYIRIVLHNSPHIHPYDFLHILLILQLHY